jgi:hypothetical protein
MKRVNLSVQQRFGIDNLITQQTGSPGKLRPLVEVQRKIALTDEEELTIKVLRREILNQPGQVEVRWDEDGAREVGVKSFDLENTQHESVRNLIKNFEGFRAADMPWVDPLIEDLDNKENDLDKIHQKKGSHATS